MMQHPKMKNIFALAVLCAGIAAGRVLAQSPDSNVARVSFVQGSVQLLAGQGAGFQQAVLNMPVLDGSSLQAGGDGQAEVEFSDGSVARLTPNSSLQFDHVGQDQVQLQQLSGLAYYEFNVGDGHPPFSVQFSDVYVQPSANSIFRLGLDAGWEVAVISGSVNVQGRSIPAVPVGQNQSIRSNADNSGGPYTIAQGINGDSWDNWNQDRDQAIAQEASQQTPVRDGSANPQDENWNDLDADGNWYPVEGAGDVWVPAGVGAGWDPYGAGYWAYYPTFGYTWVSSYPWGWLPYHCGAWNYYSFGWGWAPGGCGGVWNPVVVVRIHPPGWRMPLRPPAGAQPLPGRLLLAVDRGPVAKGPWGLGAAAPKPDHLQALNFKGQAIAPVSRTDIRAQGFVTARGTAPGSRAVLNGAFPGAGQRPSSYATPSRGIGSTEPRPSVGYSPRPAPSINQRPSVAYPPAQSFNSRSTYVPQPPPTTHYSAPAPHYSAPPAPHYSAPAPSPGPRR
jgi:FecR protein